MKHQKNIMGYEMPSDAEVLKSYMNKHSYRRNEARKMKRELRKLRFLDRSFVNDFSVY